MIIKLDWLLQPGMRDGRKLLWSILEDRYVWSENYYAVKNCFKKWLIPDLSK